LGRKVGGTDKAIMAPTDNNNIEFFIAFFQKGFSLRVSLGL
tara:strand:- start:815 stop:937 length:123 start_codon:yes stop_codon:yes gene_type:complete